MKHSELAIYLAGNIQKSHEKTTQLAWTLEDQNYLKKQLHPHELIFLNPAIRSDDLSDQKSVFGRDMMQVFFSDIVFVDARERRGLGVGAEMMWAKTNHIPVITWAPKNTHYQKSDMELLGVVVKNWVHPFVESLSDRVVDNLEEAVSWIKEFLLGNMKIKGPEDISGAMRYYQKQQLPQDIPMKEFLERKPHLKAKIEEFSSLTTS